MEKVYFTASSQITFRHMAVPISLIPSHFMFENMSVRIVCLPNKNLFYSFLSLLRNPTVENCVAQRDSRLFVPIRYDSFQDSYRLDFII